MSPDTNPTPFEIEIAVEPADIDVMGHVNNVVYLRWVQDAAVAHWTAVATEQQQRDYVWVVARHEIDYRRSAVEGDRIIARTWVGEAQKRDFERFTELVRKADGKVLARARTLWCPIDMESKRPVTVSPEVYDRFSTGSAR